MEKSNPIEIYIQTCPVPHKYSNEFHDGVFLKQHRTCAKCSTKECFMMKSDSLTKCKCGFLFLFIPCASLFLYGFTEKKPKYSANPFDINYLKQWIRGLNDIVVLKNEQHKLMWAPLHDITPCISLLFRNIESFIAKYPGNTINEKMENKANPVPAEIVKIFKTTSFLDEQLKMIRYSSSEDQIVAGRKNAFPVYKVVDKLYKIFNTFASERNVPIRLTGSSFNAPFLFDSFSSVPFILLDNAIKYTLYGNEIQIALYDIDNGGVCVLIKSMSLICDDHIFEKGYRGQNSSKVTDRGTGMGLYIAKRICDSNNCEICHSADPGTKRVIDDIAYCQNTFLVRIYGLS